MATIAYRNRWTWFGVVFVYAWILYFASNQQTLLAAHELPLTFVDRATPFLPGTVWIYAIVFVMPLAACFAAKTDADIRALVISFTAMATFDSLIFFVYPTVYPRPVLSSASGAGGLLALVRFLDTPKNCFPSQHVAAAVLTSLHVRRLAKPWGTPSLLLAAAIALSTLTTKQHYLWDVLGGALVGVAAYRLALARRELTAGNRAS